MSTRTHASSPSRESLCPNPPQKCKYRTFPLSPTRHDTRSNTLLCCNQIHRFLSHPLSAALLLPTHGLTCVNSRPLQALPPLFRSPCRSNPKSSFSSSFLLYRLLCSPAEQTRIWKSLLHVPATSITLVRLLNPSILHLLDPSAFFLLFQNELTFFAHHPSPLSFRILPFLHFSTRFFFFFFFLARTRMESVRIETSVATVWVAPFLMNRLLLFLSLKFILEMLFSFAHLV